MEFWGKQHLGRARGRKDWDPGLNRKSREGPFGRFQSKGTERENWGEGGGWREGREGRRGEGGEEWVGAVCGRLVEGEESRHEEIMGVGQKATENSQSEQQYSPGKKWW